jgi:hypothetical protein
MAIPTGLGVIAIGMWIVMLVMFRPKASVQVEQDAIVLKIANAEIVGIVRGLDELKVYTDRKVSLKRAVQRPLSAG